MASTEELTLLLSHHFPAGYIIHDVAVQPLSTGSQNFSSDIKEIKIFLINKEKKRFHLDLIMKLMPDEKKQIEVSSKLGFKKEAYFYQLVAPEFHRIQIEHNLEPQNLFSTFYAATEKIVLLGDLRSSYSTVNHSLDEEHTRLVVQELAKFHATGVVLKLSQPDTFQTILAAVATPALQNANNPMQGEINRTFRRDITTLLKTSEGFMPFAEKVDNILSNIDDKKLPIPREPYATLLHNDLWNGNILFKYSSNNKPKSVKFIDFQTTIFNSPARDLTYFLFTSVEEDLLKKFDSFCMLFHCVFVDCLSALGCNPMEFTYEKLMDEIKIYGPTKLKHILLLFRSLCVSKENGDAIFKQHLQRIVKMFSERKWI